jgi:hypothetical protein
MLLDVTHERVTGVIGPTVDDNDPITEHTAGIVSKGDRVTCSRGISDRVKFDLIIHCAASS